MVSVDELKHYVDPRNVEEYIFEMGLHPLFSAMIESLNIPHYIDEKCGPPDPRELLSTGELAKAFIINVLDQRTPVYKLADSLKYADCGVLFRPGIVSEDFTQDRLGKALDAIADIDQQKLFSEISLQAMKIHGVPVNTVHIDTTNFSVYGDYNTKPHDGFNATECGAPKSKRKDLKAVGLGAAVQEHRIPFFIQALSGNDSDAVWFRSALAKMASLFDGNLYSRPILVFDAAASNTEMFENASSSKTPSIIRLSRVFNATGESIRRAWEENRWQEVGQLANSDKGSYYSICTFDFDVVSGWRLTVVHSTTLQKTKEKSMQKSLPKKRERIEKQAAKLNKKEFETMAKAEAAALEFAEKHITLEKPFTYEVNIISETTEKYARRGRPTADTPKIKNTTYKVEFILGDLDQDLCEQWLKEESCFVLVDNVPKDRCSSKEILINFKKQWKVENMFHFIKQPLDLGPLWLEKPSRIKALLFLVSLAVLVGSFLIHRLHVTLSGKPQGKDDPKATPRKLRDITGRRVERPTFNMVRELLFKLKIICYNEDGRWVRKFLRQTDRSLINLIVDIGFSPGIYLEQYNTTFDLWNYKST